jgi:hypothetical protein
MSLTGFRTITCIQPRAALVERCRWWLSAAGVYTAGFTPVVETGDTTKCIPGLRTAHAARNTTQRAGQGQGQKGGRRVRPSAAGQQAHPTGDSSRGAH